MSLTVHGSLMTGMSYLSQPAGDLSPRARGHGDEIVLTARWGSEAESVQRVSFTSVTSRAPELLPAPPTQHFDSQVAPASASLPFQAAPQPSTPPASPYSTSASNNYSQPAHSPGPLTTETQLFGLRSRGAKFVYVFDRSSSMEGSPLSAAKRELIASLSQLDRVHQFQIIFYNQEPQLMPEFRASSPRMIFADEQGKRLAASFIGGIFADGGTDHLRSLKMALALRPDVIFFLTDANEPQMRPDELATIRHLNQGTRINTIEFGLGQPPSTHNFLHLLAEQNAGQHAYIDVQRFWR
jgi:hypothetical protein